MSASRSRIGVPCQRTPRGDSRALDALVFLATGFGVGIGLLIMAIGLVMSGAAVASAAVGACPVITAPGVYDGGWTITHGCGIRIQASDVVLRGWFIINAPGAAITIEGGDNVTIEATWIARYNAAGNQGDQYNAGIACWGCTRLRVRQTKIVQWPDNQYGNGIWVKRTNADVAGADYIENNVIYGGWDGIGSEPEDDPNGGFGDGTIIQGNTIALCNDDGIQVEGRVSGVLVLGNRVERCGAGVASAPVLVGPLTVQGNAIRDLRPAPSTAFFCFKLGDKVGGDEAVITYRDNVCLGGSARDGAGEGPGGWVQTNEGMAYSIVSRDNCVDVGRYVIEFGEAPAAADMDYDMLRTSDSERFAKWNGARLSLPGLQGLGQEQHAVIGGCP